MTLPAFVSGLAILCFTGLLVAAAISDIQRYTIPNRWCLALALLFPSYAIDALPLNEWLLSLGLASAFLAVGFVLFLMRFLGAGDAKFLAAVALWAGPTYALPFILCTAFSGGVMVFFMWLQHCVTTAPSLRLAFIQGADAGFVKQAMPYGAAIAVGGLYVAFTLLRVN